MTSHELARLLLALPDLPVATHAHGHTYMSGSIGVGLVKIGRMRTPIGDHLVLGNITKRNINPPNWYITEMLHGDAPEEWGMPAARNPNVVHGVTAGVIK